MFYHSLMSYITSYFSIIQLFTMQFAADLSNFNNNYKQDLHKTILEISSPNKSIRSANEKLTIMSTVNQQSQNVSAYSANSDSSDLLQRDRN